MTKRLVLMGAIILAIGCNQTAPQSNNGKTSPEQNPAAASKLDPLVMAQKPANAISVRDALTRKEGEKVVVTGQVPTEKVKPYNAAVASFVMLSTEDMAREEVREEFECEEAATCPSCRKLLDSLGVRVEV